MLHARILPEPPQPGRPHLIDGTWELTGKLLPGAARGWKVTGRLRRVLLRRGLTLTAGQDARIEACDDLAQLERWLDEAIVAASAAEALR